MSRLLSGTMPNKYKFNTKAATSPQPICETVLQKLFQKISKRQTIMPK
jgi:hypothetical protein